MKHLVPDSSVILKEIKENGIYKFDKPLSQPKLLEEALCRANEHFAAPGNNYEFGKACRIGGHKTESRDAIHQAFSSPLIWDIARGFFDTSTLFSEIFLTHDYVSGGPPGRNGWLHFDRIPTLKFFMHLTNIDKDNGPFCYVPGSYKLGKEMRNKSKAEESQYAKVKNRLEVDFPELGYTTESATPILGPPGTMFAFHSDLFHCGGNTKEGSERKIVRLHLRNHGG